MPTNMTGAVTGRTPGNAHADNSHAHRDNTHLTTHILLLVISLCSQNALSLLLMLDFSGRFVVMILLLSAFCPLYVPHSLF